MRKGGAVIFSVYLFFGLYFINSSLNFVTLPAFVAIADKWLMLVGGVLIIVGGINFLRTHRRKY